jgi:hypothetical protein
MDVVVMMGKAHRAIEGDGKHAMTGGATTLSTRPP